MPGVPRSGPAGACPHCDGAGWYKEAVPFGHPNFARLFRCACGQAKDRTAAAAVAKQRLCDELVGLTDKTFAAFELDRPLAPLYQLGGRYLASLAHVPMEQRKAAKEFDVLYQAGALEDALHDAQRYAECLQGWVCFHGAYGAGKSHLAAAICHHLVDAGAEVRYRSVPGMLDAIKAGFDTGTADAIFADLLRCDLLVLDDLGAQHLTGWSYERLFRLLNERTDRPTIITANVHPDALGAPNDVDACRLASRIAGSARLVWLPISDYRRLKEKVA